MAPLTRARANARSMCDNDLSSNDVKPGITLMAPATKKRKRPASKTGQKSPIKLARARTPPTDEKYGLIQEKLQDNLYALLIQHILWNQTSGRAARPVLDAILALYPTPEKLAQAEFSYLAMLLYPIGLYNRRAKRLIDFAQAWVERPPHKSRRYRRVDYPSKGCGRDIGPNEILGEDDPREGWEIAHLPGIGPYALDGYRMFYRDKLRYEPDETPEIPEWQTVVPLDKELRPYMVWRWKKEGFDYNILTGAVTRIDLAQAAS